MGTLRKPVERIKALLSSRVNIGVAHQAWTRPQTVFPAATPPPGSLKELNLKKIFQNSGRRLGRVADPTFTPLHVKTYFIFVSLNSIFRLDRPKYTYGICNLWTHFTTITTEKVIS